MRDNKKHVRLQYRFKGFSGSSNYHLEIFLTFAPPVVRQNCSTVLCTGSDIAQIEKA